MRGLFPIALAAFLALCRTGHRSGGRRGHAARTAHPECLVGGRGATSRSAGSGARFPAGRNGQPDDSDSEGVWLILNDAVLDWNRSALLRGRLQVNELFGPARIEMPRLPVADEDAALTPEASGTGSACPELPVAVIVEELSADELVLGAPVLGQRLTMTLDGALRLDGGEGRDQPRSRAHRWSPRRDRARGARSRTRRRS